MRNMEALTCARVFYNTWVAELGAPTFITMDRGYQFESELFNALLCLIRTKKIRTIAYHPQSNGHIERWHRDVKAAIMCNDKQWTEVLLTVFWSLKLEYVWRRAVYPLIYCMQERFNYPANLFCATMPFRVLDPSSKSPGSICVKSVQCLLSCPP